MPYNYHTELIITGSDILFIREARMYFPGRRGNATQVDFHFYPLSFREFITLTKLLKNAPEQNSKNFTDPFIFHALQTWITTPKNPYEQMQNTVNDPIWSSRLIEAVVVNHYRRYFPTYYIKAEGEVDIAYVKDKHFWPVEIKWTNQLRSKDLSQIAKYNNGIILTKNNQPGLINNIKTMPLWLKLLEF